MGIRKKIAALNTKCDEQDGVIDDLKDALKKEEKERQEAEESNRSLICKLQLIESDLDKAQEKLATAKSSLALAEKQRDDFERMLKKLENIEQSTSDKLDTQADELKEARHVAEEADRK